jgi:hypothetical protein
MESRWYRDEKIFQLERRAIFSRVRILSYVCYAKAIKLILALVLADSFFCRKVQEAR